MGVGGHSFEGLWGPPALGLLLLQPHEQSYMCMCSPCRQAWVQQHASWMLLCGVGWGLVKKKVCPEIACAPLSKAPSLSREATEKLSNAWMQDVAASVCGPMYMCIHIHIGPPCDKQLHVHLVVYAVNLAQTLPANQIPHLHTMWQWNEDWGSMEMHGWLYVQGFWSDGVVLTWHVELHNWNALMMEYSSVWVCYLWQWSVLEEDWIMSWLRNVEVWSDGIHGYIVQPWMLHEW